MNAKILAIVGTVAGLGLLGLGTQTAKADGFSFRVSIGAPVYTPPVVVQQAPQVVYQPVYQPAPQPVACEPAPQVIYQQAPQVVYVPAPVYQQPRIVYLPAPAYRPDFRRDDFRHDRDDFRRDAHVVVRAPGRW